MHRTLSLLLFVVVTTVAAPAFGQQSKYRAPRTEGGQPDLQGVWNFNSGVPLQRPAAFSDKKFFTKEEFDKQRADDPQWAWCRSPSSLPWKPSASTGSTTRRPSTTFARR